MKAAVIQIQLLDQTTKPHTDFSVCEGAYATSSHLKNSEFHVATRSGCSGLKSTFISPISGRPVILQMKVKMCWKPSALCVFRLLERKVETRMADVSPQHASSSDENIRHDVPPWRGQISRTFSFSVVFILSPLLWMYNRMDFNVKVKFFVFWNSWYQRFFS